MNWPFVTSNRYQADIAALRAEIEKYRAWAAEIDKQLGRALPDSKLTQIGGGIPFRPW